MATAEQRARARALAQSCFMGNVVEVMKELVKQPNKM